jgi:hypothetical protein
MSSDDRKKTRLLIAALVWLLVIAGGVAAWHFLVNPLWEGWVVTSTSSESRYKGELKFRTDAFSGYAFFRSPAFSNLLRQEGYRIEIEDDAADYMDRMEALQNGDVQFAVFPLNSYIEAGAEIGEFPATIVLVVDETTDADAIVSYSGAVASFDDLDDESARFVLTPDSPSEFLARVVKAQFALPRLPEDWYEPVDGAEEVYRRFVDADRNEKRAYVLWEPFVTLALQEPGAHMLLGSSKLRGFIIDCLVVERGFLKDEPEMVRMVVEAYLRAAYSYTQTESDLVELIRNDASATGQQLSADQAANVVNGIEWKNTTENYSYFGMTPSAGVRTLEDSIISIADVLVKTDAISDNPLDGRENTILYDDILDELRASDFHPGKRLSSIDVGLGAGDLQEARQDADLEPLSDEEWQSLIPVGTVRVPPLSFSRGTARIGVQSRRDLDQLAQTLGSFPLYYLKVIGNARAEGDVQANMHLAEQRAAAARDYLLSLAVAEARVRAVAAKPSAGGGSAQSVTFVLAERPY